ncbi:MAG: Methionine aminopeptidase [Parcubacteria group bacterium GW2011_GWA1_45_7]|nr:MAG: Methionine aminopeptidase [Parcubacteria group bacterium GW2011_GWA1_45_7]
MISLKTEKDIELLRIGGKILSRVLRMTSKKIKPGATARELDEIARSIMKEQGVKPSFLGYRSMRHSDPFPGALCVSVNDVIVHGVPTQDLVLRNGDIVTIDGGLIYKGRFVDAATTVAIGKVPRAVGKLIRVTREALNRAIKVCVQGNVLGDIGYAVQSYVEAQGFSVCEELVGHGVGYGVHEDPAVPNRGRRGEGMKLEPGMVLALEPMVCMGSGKIIENSDGSFATADRSIAAHFEHTVVITGKKPLVVT